MWKHRSPTLGEAKDAESGSAWAWHLVAAFVGLPIRPALHYVIPRARWSNDWDGHYITRCVGRQFGLRTRVTDAPPRGRGHIHHFGSAWAFLNNLQSASKRGNAVVTTVFHGDRSGRFPELRDAMDRVVAHAETFDRLVVACGTMESRFADWGVPVEKIVRIPLGVDLSIFRSPAAEERSELREKYGIPTRALCVGSFQKDGNGWGEGDTPKLIKGPDVFLEVVRRLKQDFGELFVLLTGPARGFIRAGLERYSVPYRHIYVKNYHQIRECYSCLDLYLVTSREEGGPKAVLEAPACGVPVVSTKVGMAPDVLVHEKSGLLADVDDVETLHSMAGDLLSCEERRHTISARGLDSVKAYDWSQVAAAYYEKVYGQLLGAMRE